MYHNIKGIARSAWLRDLLIDLYCPPTQRDWEDRLAEAADAAAEHGCILAEHIRYPRRVILVDSSWDDACLSAGESEFLDCPNELMLSYSTFVITVHDGKEWRSGLARAREAVAVRAEKEDTALRT